MKILLLGKTGNLGRGIFHVFNQETDFELIAPSKSELELTDRIRTVEYVSRIKPKAIINSASYTTNKSTSIDEAIKISETNLIVSDNLQWAASSCSVDKYIDIGSSSIYERFPNRVITEKDFPSINDYMPILPYANAKLIQTKHTIAKISSDTRWISLILPYIISFNQTGLRDTGGLFARISKQITQYINDDNKLMIFESLDLAIKRQFVHSIDVGYFCKYLLENQFVNGLVHMPKLQQMSINFFIQKHLEKLVSQSNESFIFTSHQVQHPELGSIWDDLIEFDYKFTPEKCVELLQKK